MIYVGAILLPPKRKARYYMKNHFPVLQYVNPPNLVTTLGMAFGVAACYYLVIGSLRGTIVCLFLAMFMDVLDGFIAGKLNCKSAFGQQMDSIVDFFVCCAMPVWMVFSFVGIDVLLVVSLVFYAACGLWRLAHFNVTAHERRPYFTGLPVPGALVIACLVIWLTVYCALPVWPLAAALTLTGVLMVSSFKIKKYGPLQKAVWVAGAVFVVVVIVL